MQAIPQPIQQIQQPIFQQSSSVTIDMAQLVTAMQLLQTMNLQNGNIQNQILMNQMQQNPPAFNSMPMQMPIPQTYVPPPTSLAPAPPPPPPSLGKAPPAPPPPPPPPSFGKDVPPPPNIASIKKTSIPKAAPKLAVAESRVQTRQDLISDLRMNFRKIDFPQNIQDDLCKKFAEKIPDDPKWNEKLAILTSLYSPLIIEYPRQPGIVLKRMKMWEDNLGPYLELLLARPEHKNGISELKADAVRDKESEIGKKYTTEEGVASYIR
eukprot:TRINITY_DN8123_c0_g1_i1.p2 TRINITY_DN8123_c0_g1~~TRINITY_DN8123_c0_g1_i1.p2  ORF type:complete len:266 (-),score=70.44 TRINITY_DN8123_c0_g1_i1:21-818(-)